MSSRMKIILLAGTALLIGICIFSVPLILPSVTVEPKDTPTPTMPIPKDLPTLPEPGQGLADATPTQPIIIETAVVTDSSLAVPSPFDIDLYFTNVTCGGGDAMYSYAVSIALSLITLNQMDADIITTGEFNGSLFSTSADVGPGIENYTGTITYDGETITMSGLYGWTPDSGSSCGADFSGTTTP